MMHPILKPIPPNKLEELERKTLDMGFGMSSDRAVGALLRALVRSKPTGNFLELGTGTGLGSCWILDGMDAHSKLTTIDIDPRVLGLARNLLGTDIRCNFICADASIWITKYKGGLFDLIFADAWPGKYSELEETLALVKKGGIYFIDDLLKQANWPKGHPLLVNGLLKELHERADMDCSFLNWSTGIVIAVKK